jgi:hypothetical protein
VDPDETLRELLELATDGEPEADGQERMGELILALDAWILRGGFLPGRWDRTPQASRDALGGYDQKADVAIPLRLKGKP